MKPDAREKQELADMQLLVEMPAFNRFLWRVIQTSGFFRRATDGSRDACLLNEGRRSLGLDVLSMVEAGQPASHDRDPIFTMIRVLREEATPTQQETDHVPSKRTERFNRHDELDDTDADEDDRR